MLIFTKAAFSLLLSASLFYIPANAQETVTTPHTGNNTYKMGDSVEATFAGNWVKAIIVGVDEAPEKYKVHFKGEKYCNNHATDSYLDRAWVRPRTKPGNTRTTNSNTSPDLKQTGSAGIGGKYKAGDTVMYTNVGAVWLGGATVEAYDPVRRSYKLRLDGGSGDIVPCHSVAKLNQFDNQFFLGKWDVYVSGSVSTTVKSGVKYNQFSGGLKVASLDINPNGTFIWRQKGKKDIAGVWKPRTDAPGVTIIKGIDGKDWTIFERTEGYAPTATTRDEIGFHDKKLQTGYYVAYRIGPNQSCILVDRKFK